MDSLYTTGLLELQNMELEQRSLVQEGMIKERDLTVLRLTRQLKAAHKVKEIFPTVYEIFYGVNLFFLCEPNDRSIHL